MKPTRTFSDDLVSRFYDLGVRDAFVVTGGAIAGFTEALAKSNKITCHYMLTEQSASIAAEAYGKHDDTPALLVVTSGPGVTNALTGVAAAWTNSSPVIVVSGQARTTDIAFSVKVPNRQFGNQHVNTVSIVQSTVKWVIEPLTCEDASPHQLADQLFGASVTNRPGPAWLSLPSDLQRSPMDGPRENTNIPKSIMKIDQNDELIDDIQSLFRNSTKPLILLGNGARVKGKLPESIFDFINSNGIPVLTTWPALDLIPEDFNFYFGRPGTIASDYVPNVAIQNTDALLIIGAKLDLAQIGFRPENFATKANVLRIDIDQAEFARIPYRKNWKNRQLSTEHFQRALQEVPNLEKDFSHWNSFLRKTPSVGNATIPVELKDGLNTYKFIESLGKRSISHVVSGSSGTCIEMVLQRWPSQKNQSFFVSCGLGSMGFALSSAIGIYAKTREPILIIESDGSLAMNLQDLETISKFNLNLKIVVLNSNGYKSIKLSQRRQGQLPHGVDASTGLHLPEINAWANAARIEAMDLIDEQKTEKLLDWLFATTRPRLLNVRVSAEQEAIPRVLSRLDSNGKMQTDDFGDLWPEYKQ